MCTMLLLFQVCIQNSSNSSSTGHQAFCTSAREKQEMRSQMTFVYSFLAFVLNCTLFPGPEGADGKPEVKMCMEGSLIHKTDVGL